MKKYLLLLLVCFCTSAVMAQRPFEPTYLGTLAGLTLNLDDNVPNRYEFEIPLPKEKVNTTTWQDTYLEEGWNQCYYEICISINMNQY